MMEWIEGAGWGIGLATGLVGALAATVLGFLTFGVQTTAAPRGVPLAIAVSPGPAGQALAPVVEQVAAQGKEALDWRIVDPARATELLDDTEVYGVLEITQTASGGVAITTTTSGAVNASGTIAAEQVLGRAGGAVAQAIASRTGAAPAVSVQTVHPSALAARSLPLAATALLWLGGLAAPSPTHDRAGSDLTRLATRYLRIGECQPFNDLLECFLNGKPISSSRVAAAE